MRCYDTHKKSGTYSEKRFLLCMLFCVAMTGNYSSLIESTINIISVSNGLWSYVFSDRAMPPCPMPEEPLLVFIMPSQNATSQSMRFEKRLIAMLSWASQIPMTLFERREK